MKKETRSLLRKRATLLAKETEEEIKRSVSAEIIEFTIAKEHYGIESEFVREVYPLKDFTHLPGVPSFVYGIINVRGQIMAVVDLKKFFNLPEKGLGELDKVIILQDEKMEFGILADEVYGTKSIYMEEILPVPITVSGIGKDYLKGVLKDHTVILEARRIMSDEKMIINDEMM